MPLWEILTISKDCAPTFLKNNSKEMRFSYCQRWFQVIILKSVYYLVWTLSLSEEGWWFVFCFPQWNQFNFQDYPNSVFWEREIITNKSASYCFLNAIFIFQTIFFSDFNRLMLFRGNIVFLDFHCLYVCDPSKTKLKWS